ncbi:MAG: N-6 DNA methylase [Intestinibacter bartlettii]
MWVGLPKISDGQMLFDLNGLKKLKYDGELLLFTICTLLIILAAGSGRAQIKKIQMLENDSVDAIIQLPNDTFYNTGITTYIWIM